MSDETALLAAIYANPDDDTPRLVYADWLDEHGDAARAEFIRVQIELSYLADDDARERPLCDRQCELSVHRQRWLAEAGLVEGKGIGFVFRRGFVDGLFLGGYEASDLNIISRIPGLRRVRLSGGALTPTAVQALAALDLDLLTISGTPFPCEWLELLEPLPCGTVLDITPKGEPFGYNVWYEFQARRIDRLARLSPEERHSQARSWQRGHHERGVTRGAMVVSVREIWPCDLEMPLLAELTSVDEVRITSSDLSTAGIEHIAKLPNLKSLDLSWVPVESITPLARCRTLEKLQVVSQWTRIDDAGTEGLERLVNLRELTLRSIVSADHTLTRLGALRKLTSLDIEFESVENEESFAALAHLTALERLSIDGDVPGGALRFLAPCRELQTVSIRVPTGGADGFAALAALTKLRELRIEGDAVTDEAIRHLTSLKKLRTLMAQNTLVTPGGARWLADRLPEATIILNEHVAKSRRSVITFCRRSAEDVDFVSALLPTHWSGRVGRSVTELSGALTEDGWENIDERPSRAVEPAEIRMYLSNGHDSVSTMNAIVQGNQYLQSCTEAREVVELDEIGAACVYSFGGNRSLVAAVALERGCAVLECTAASERFEEFRPLFEFVARSFRIGEAAREGVGEEVTVAVSEL